MDPPGRIHRMTFHWKLDSLHSPRKVPRRGKADGTDILVYGTARPPRSFQRKNIYLSVAVNLKLAGYRLNAAGAIRPVGKAPCEALIVGGEINGDRGEAKSKQFKKATGPR